MALRLTLLASAVCACLALSCAPRSTPLPQSDALVAPPQITGQWIWTRADAEIFARTREKHPELMASVLAATIVNASRGLELRRGLAPSAGGEAAPVALVVRIDDSLHALWDARGVDGVGDDLGPLLARVLSEARATGAEISEIQLDYDAPERRLAAWASVVARLADKELAGVPLWITSIPTHLDDPDYGARLAGHVRGHILQLFDTGLACTPSEVERVRAAAYRQPIPFRLGVAVFERTKRGARTTSHGCWADSVAAFRGARFGGVWVFPAGRDYESRVAPLEGDR